MEILFSDFMFTYICFEILFHVKNIILQNNDYLSIAWAQESLISWFTSIPSVSLRGFLL